MALFRRERGAHGPHWRHLRRALRYDDDVAGEAMDAARSADTAISTT